VKLIVPNNKLNTCCRMLALGQAEQGYLFTDLINRHGTIVALPLGPVYQYRPFAIGGGGGTTREINITALAYDEDSNHLYALRTQTPDAARNGTSVVMECAKARDLHNAVMYEWLAGNCEGTFLMRSPIVTTERLVLSSSFEVHTPQSEGPTLIPQVNGFVELPIVTVDIRNIGYLE
jgi:hypothetical protein